jgi:hypothetical protein
MRLGRSGWFLARLLWNPGSLGASRWPSFMTLETRRYRRALKLALGVAGHAATLEECRARLSICLNLIDKLGGSMQGENLLREVGRRLETVPARPKADRLNRGGDDR